MPKERFEASGARGPVTNTRIARILAELADVLEVGGTDSFRVRAYRTAARRLEGLGESAAHVATTGGVKALKELPSIGEAMAKKIVEIVETGTLAKLDEARKKVPHELTDLLGIEGLGPKKLHVLHRELGVGDLVDLERVLAEGRVAELAGFGKRSEQKLNAAIERFRRHLGRYRRADVEPVASELRAALLALPGVRRVEVAGSFRRGRETIGDVDLLAIADDPPLVMRAFASASGVEDVIVSGETKTSIRLTGGLQVDLRIVDEESFGAALHYFTGSKEHNVRIRGMARDVGLKINEYGVFRGDERIAGGREEEVYRVVGCDWIPPELREDRGEFDAARTGTLPELLTTEDMLGDLQMHSTASDGKNTVEEMALAARELGRQYIAITDHSKAVAVANGLDDRRMREHAEAIRAVRVPGIRVLTSVEVDIMKDGSLDLLDNTLAQLDLVVASVHSSMQLPQPEMTARVLRAIESGLIHVLAHPTGRLLLRREPYEIDMEAVIQACVAHGVALEINAHPARLDLSDVHARMARDLGAKIVISTDAHTAEDLALMRHGVGVARRAWLTRGDVLNTLPADGFLEAIAR